MKQAAIVTLLLGQNTTFYDTHFIPSIKAYADKWGFDFIPIRTPLESIDIDSLQGFHKKHAFCIQKLLILEQPWAKDYKYVILMDADILVNFAKAPNMVEGLEEGKIGVVPERYLFGTIPIDSSIFEQISSTHPKTAEEYYRRYNFPQAFSKQINSGVVIYQPAYHTTFLKDVYTKYAKRIYNGDDIDGDQGPLNYEGHVQGVFQYIDERWNRVWLFYQIALYRFLDPVYDKQKLQQAMRSIFDLTYCLHLTGHVGWDLLV